MFPEDVGSPIPGKSKRKKKTISDKRKMSVGWYTATSSIMFVDYQEASVKEVLNWFTCLFDGCKGW